MSDGGIEGGGAAAAVVAATGDYPTTTTTSCKPSTQKVNHATSNHQGSTIPQGKPMPFAALSYATTAACGESATAHATSQNQQNHQNQGPHQQRALAALAAAGGCSPQDYILLRTEPAPPASLSSSSSHHPAHHSAGAPPRLPFASPDGSVTFAVHISLARQCRMLSAALDAIALSPPPPASASAATNFNASTTTTTSETGHNNSTNSTSHHPHRSDSNNSAAVPPPSLPPAMVVVVPDAAPSAVARTLLYLTLAAIRIPTVLSRPLRAPLAELVQPWELRFLHRFCLDRLPYSSDGDYRGDLPLPNAMNTATATATATASPLGTTANTTVPSATPPLSAPPASPPWHWVANDEALWHLVPCVVIVGYGSAGSSPATTAATIGGMPCVVSIGGDSSSSSSSVACRSSSSASSVAAIATAAHAAITDAVGATNTAVSTNRHGGEYETPESYSQRHGAGTANAEADSIGGGEGEGDPTTVKDAHRAPPSQPSLADNASSVPDPARHRSLLSVMRVADFLVVDPLRDLCCALLASIVLECTTPAQLLRVLALPRPATNAELAPVFEAYPFLTPPPPTAAEGAHPSVMSAPAGSAAASDVASRHHHHGHGQHSHGHGHHGQASRHMGSTYSNDDN